MCSDATRCLSLYTVGPTCVSCVGRVTRCRSGAAGLALRGGWRGRYGSLQGSLCSWAATRLCGRRDSCPPGGHPSASMAKPTATVHSPSVSCWYAIRSDVNSKRPCSSKHSEATAGFGLDYQSFFGQPHVQAEQAQFCLTAGIQDQQQLRAVG